MSEPDPLAIALKVEQMAMDVLVATLAAMDMEGWRPEFRTIVLRAIGQAAMRVADELDGKDVP